MSYKPTMIYKNIIILTKTDEWKGCLEYAIKKGYDVIYDDLKNPDAIKVMYNFQNKGFGIELSEIEAHKTDGTMEQIINCRFINK